jgi:hypothetical protein
VYLEVERFEQLRIAWSTDHRQIRIQTPGRAQQFDEVRINLGPKCSQSRRVDKHAHLSGGLFWPFR